MWNQPSRIELERIPSFGETKHISQGAKIIHMHFSLFGNDWYAAEYDSEQKLLYAYTIKGYNLPGGKWEFVNYEKLCEFKTEDGWENEREKFWVPVQAFRIENIRRNYNLKPSQLIWRF